MRVTITRSDTLSRADQAAARAAGLGALLRRCGDALNVPAAAGLTVRLTDDAELAQLNGRFLNNPAPTDVLAFPAEEEGGSGYVGDIAVSVERAVAQNPADGVAELRLLAVHGLLHCVGHDHGTAQDAAAMTAATRALLPDQVVPELMVPVAGAPAGVSESSP